MALRCFGYEGFAAEPTWRHRVPRGTVKIVFRFGDPLRSVAGPLRSPVPTTAHALVVGIKDRPGSTQHHGCLHSMQLHLTPLAAYELLGVPMRELSHRVTDLADVLGPHVNLLVEQLAALDSWAARRRVLSGFLTRRAVPDPAVAWAWRRLRESTGRIRVASLASEIGISRHHLSRRFHDQVGLAPKSLARVLRFRSALRLAGSGVSWGRVAADSGYYDQAHLNAEFRAIAGCAPGEFFRRATGLVVPF
ncbi:helix-turn-helix domain-containing protein [Allokutzneria sp. A3M-2-11 16]|uniref:helix-turn-helix domain-containing protein n=1 Tax=Allokutzneria sp. A3M-2-11 16 TaxID=2962043 RepID=UPI0020B74969|nr:helix-turn-helix domain-containing protein [Allokutzneria sp. A3M-2-11 16]MCP3803911.1 helix-turn-helix domain-containing protein [Allokutzneria sp. A3M-2-11 16]